MEHLERIEKLILEKRQKIKDENQKIAPIKTQVNIKEHEVYNLKLEIIKADNRIELLEEEIVQLQTALEVLKKIETVGIGE